MYVKISSEIFSGATREVRLTPGRWRSGHARAPESICRFLYIFMLGAVSLIWLLKTPNSAHMKLDKINLRLTSEKD